MTTSSPAQKPGTKSNTPEPAPEDLGGLLAQLPGYKWGGDDGIKSRDKPA